VELIGTYSNKAYLTDQYTDLRELLHALPVRPTKPHQAAQTRRWKRRLGRAEIDEIIAKYQSGVSSNRLMSDHHLAKRTISKLLKANGVHMRRQGLTDEQDRDAATLYIAGRSLAWMADHFGGLSPTTVARALQGQGVILRPRQQLDPIQQLVGCRARRAPPEPARELPLSVPPGMGRGDGS